MSRDGPVFSTHNGQLSIDPILNCTCVLFVTAACYKNRSFVPTTLAESANKCYIS